MYTDYCLKFKDAAEADAVLFTEQTNVQDDVVETIKAPRYAAIDVIGTIYKPTGNMLTTDEGEQPEMAPLTGWHVNVRLKADQETPANLEQYKVAPANPVRVWA